MKVILKKDFVHLGREGEIKEVKDGYARNFLIPRGIAIVATPGAINALKASEEKRKKKLQQKIAALKELALHISQLTLSFTRTKNEEGVMFGSVTKNDIIKSLKAANINVSKEQIVLPSPIKEFGVFEVKVNLMHDISATFKVNITPI
jgi:large subunit ribosomal protein L9